MIPAISFADSSHAVIKDNYEFVMFQACTQQQKYPIVACYKKRGFMKRLWVTP